MDIKKRIMSMTSPKEKLEYLLDKIAGDNPASVKEDAATLFSHLTQGVAPDKLIETFGLSGTYNPGTGNASPTLTIDVNGRPIVCLVVDPDRKDFKDAHPEEKRPVKSFLTEDELSELTNA